ncbi:hypothetical protein AB0L00_42340 [Actinoallomurus sp. NPDC052308]
MSQPIREAPPHHLPAEPSVRIDTTLYQGASALEVGDALAGLYRNAF